MSLGRRNLKAMAKRIHILRVQSDAQAAANPDSEEFEEGWAAGWDACVEAISIALGDVDAGCDPARFREAARGR